MTNEWVATETFANEDTDSLPGLIEAGGVYARQLHDRYGDVGRLLVAGETLVACPRCGQRFADTDEGAADTHMLLHFEGDDDCPSICRHIKPTLTLVTP